MCEPFSCAKGPTRGDGLCRISGEDRILQNVFAEIGVPRDFGELAFDIGGIDRHRLAPALLGIEADVLQYLLHHGLEAAGADILDLAVYLGGDAGDGAHAVVGEVHRDALGGDQRRILLGEARVGLLEDADEVLLGERLQLDTDGKAALEFRSEEHTSELQSLMRISYAVFCLKQQKTYK